MKPVLLLLLSASLLAAPRDSRAEGLTGAPVSPLAMVAAGVMVVDGLLAVGNGIQLANGAAKKANGYFSIGMGVVSWGFVAAAYATEGDSGLENQFAAVMGTAGTAALVTGILVVRQAGRKTDEPKENSRLSVYPAVISDGNRGKAIGLGVRFDF